MTGSFISMFNLQEMAVFVRIRNIMKGDLVWGTVTGDVGLWSFVGLWGLTFSFIDGSGISPILGTPT